MSKAGAFSFRAASAKGAGSMASPDHDKRKKEYMEKMRNSKLAAERSIVEDIRDDLSRNNIYYELHPGKSLDEYKHEAEERYRKSTGQKPQKKSVFIRPVVMSVDGNVTLEKMKLVAAKVKEMTGMTMLAAYFHADEGHYSISKKGKLKWIPNYHIHAYFLSQHLEDYKYHYSYVDKKGELVKVIETVKAGRTCRNLPFSQLQTELAPIFEMERGEVRNGDPTAFLDPTIKFARERSYQAAQLIKAKAKRKEEEEERERAKAKFLDELDAKQSEIDILDRAIESKRESLNELSQQETVALAENPSLLQIRRFLQENRDAIYNNISNIISQYYPGELEGMDLRVNNAGDRYEELEMNDNGNIYHLQVFFKTGNVYHLSMDGSRTKRQPIHELAEYLKAEITPEMREYLEESFPVTKELKEKKKAQNVAKKQSKGPSIG